MVERDYGDEFSVFQDPDETFEFRYVDPVFPVGHARCRTWPEDSAMTFKAFRDQADDEAINLLTTKMKVKYDRDAARTAAKNGKAYSADLEQEMKMTQTLALILTQCRGWRGSAFRIPKWAKTSSGEPHPRRGELAPCNEFYLKKMNPVVLAAIETRLEEEYEPKRSPEDEERFPDHGVRVDESAGDGDGEGILSAHGGSPTGDL